VRAKADKGDMRVGHRPCGRLRSERVIGDRRASAGRLEDWQYRIMPKGFRVREGLEPARP